MRKSYFVIFVAFLTTLMFSSCGTSRKTTETAGSANTAVETATLFNKVMANKSKATCVNAKVKMKLATGKQNISTSGRLRMKRGEVVQLMLFDPLLGVSELGRMEFTPTNVVIIDRFNKRYIDVPYSDISFLNKAGIDFNCLEALFWAELFKPGTKNPQAEQFNIGSAVGDVVDIDYTDKMLKYEFMVSLSKALLNKTYITGTRSSDYELSCDYDDYENFAGKKFPKNIELAFKSEKKTTSINMQLGTIEQDSDWETRTKIQTSKYTKVTPDQIFKILTDK